jgi:hypothetical protein
MIRELKTWVWQCSICRELSAPINSIHKPTELPAGWERTYQRHCDRCRDDDPMDWCPTCFKKNEK